MALYLVIRHKKNPRQPFQNIWLDDELLASIQTTLKISELCNNEKISKHPVYIHRCGYKDCPPMICCSANVANVAEVGGWIVVEFSDQIRLEIVPTEQPIQHQNYYLAPSQ